MKIAIDIQGIQSEGSRTRGIGRYAIEIVKNLIRYYPDDDYVLVANGALKDVRNIFVDELNLTNVHYFEWYSPCPLAYTSKNKVTREIGTYIRSYSFSCLHIDIILVTSFLEGFIDNSLTDFDYDLITIPIVSIFYDLIPLLNHELYLKNNSEFNKYYSYKLDNFKKLDGLLAISNSSRNEVINYLQYNSKNVFNISSACDRNIFNLEIKKHNIFHTELDKLYPYILYTGACDPRKNIRGLLEAFSKLSNDFDQYKLVLVGKLLNPEIDMIDNYINLFKIESHRVIKTGYVSDSYLSSLYQKCSLFIFPSFHEGFGLPVLEAMSCGAPVIGSNKTSIVEVIANQTAMFDPNNINEITNLIEKSLSSSSYRKELIENAKEQSKKFSWQNTAIQAMTSLRLIVENSSSYDNQCDWRDLSSINKKLLYKLFNKILSNKLIKENLNDHLLCKISASVDLINIQVSKLNRFFSNDHEIISWRTEGPFDSSYSLSILNRCFSEALSKKILNFSVYNTDGFGDYETNISYLKKYPNIYKLFDSSKSHRFDSQVTSRNLYPPRVFDLNSKYNLLHCYGWEESEIPAKWVDDFNTYLQGITVMSFQVKKILVDNGVFIPLEVAGLGLDHFDEVRPDISYQVKARDFKFLHISSCFPRKGIDILLKAYGMKFSANDNVSLIIKTFKNPHNNVQELLNECRAENSNYPHVVLIQEDLSDSEIKSLFLQSNVLVAPSRGEGFGFPIAVAMLLKVPVITTGWGGQTDFCNDSNSWLIDYTFAEAKTHFNLDNSYWAEPSIVDLANKLEELFKVKKLEIASQLDCAFNAVKLLKWDQVAINNINFINEKIRTKLNKNTKLGWVTTWNTRCGIASYSKHLLENIHKNVVILTPLEEDELTYEDPRVKPSWNVSSNLPNSLAKLTNTILSNQITTVIVQFNYGLFNFNSLSQMIDKLNENKVKIILVLHSTIDPINNKEKSLISLVDWLKKCERILVHTLQDLNRLKNMGLVNNTCLFPHGILEYNPIRSKLYNLSNFTFNNRKKIASFGFCLPNKGFKELINAADILNRRGFNFELTIYSAVYNQSYNYLHQELSDLISELHLENIVKIDFEYKSDHELLDCFHSNDLLVFPYQSSNESSSASVRHGLASLKPVLVTPLEIFSDVSSLVSYLPGFLPADIANGVIKWFSREGSKSGTDVNKNIQVSEIIRSRGFSVLSKRLIGIVNGLEMNED